MRAQPSNAELARRRFAILAELGRKASTVFEFTLAPGMALLGTAEDLQQHREPVRVVAVQRLEGSARRVTMYDPGNVAAPLYVDTFTAFQSDPLVDLSDPATFGHLYRLGWELSDEEADRVYPSLDLGSLTSSAEVLIDALRLRMPF